MTDLLTHYFKRFFFFLTVLIGLFITTSVRAQTTGSLRAMGEAMERHYDAVTHLAGHPSSSQLREIHRKSYKQAKEVWENEMPEKMSLFQKKADKAVTSSVQKHGLSSAQIKKAAAEQGETAVDIAKDSETGSSTRSTASYGSSSARASRDSTTGEVSGVDGAKSVEFGKGTRKQPVVIDGILQVK